MFMRSPSMSTIWMTALLSLGARSCRGFRSSTSLSIPLAQSHLCGFRDSGTKDSRITGCSYNFVRKLGGFGYKNKNDNYSSRSLSVLQSSSSSNNSSSTTTTNLITSPKSQTVKKIQALLSKRKQRLKHGQTIVEGPRMVFDLLDNPKTSHLVKQVLVSARDYELRDDYRSRLFDNDTNGVLVQLVHPEIFQDCTDTISPQGIVAIVDIPEVSLFGDENEKNDAKLAPMYLVLDGVSDPGNLGTLLRSSLAVGVAGVVLLPDCCDAWNPKAVRSAMGASFQIPILETKSWEDALETLCEKGGVDSIYAATMIEEDDDEDAPSASLPYFEVDWTRGPSALVIGSEGNGLSEVVRQALVSSKEKNNDVVVGATHIPMESGIESLNAGVCGSVILFEYARQCS